MKKLKSISILMLLLCCFCFLSNLVSAQQASKDSTGEESFFNPKSQLKMLFGDLGYGTRGLSAALGFRYGFLGVDLGLGGFTRSNIPNYNLYPTKEIPFPKNYDSTSYPTLSVSFDLIYYYDTGDFSFYGGVGYYSQSDTVLAKSLDQGNTYGTYFYKQVNKKSGFCFTLGGQYFISETIMVGLGYHTKKGVFAEVGYWWY